MDIDSLGSAFRFTTGWEEQPAKRIQFVSRRDEKPGTGVSLPFGAHSERETPVPIPNTAVKPLSGYNTWGPPLGK
jgi:hypothetical protein